MLSKKSQAGLYFAFLFVILGLIYFVGLSGFVGEQATYHVVYNNMTGLDGWFYTNINFVIFICYLIGLAGMSKLAQ